MIRIGAICRGSPSPVGPPALELVGQPFLRDHDQTRSWSSGPLRPGVCDRLPEGRDRGAGSPQLGFPDAIVVIVPFGIYVADEVLSPAVRKR